MLFGDEFARGLYVPLGSLAKDSGVDLRLRDASESAPPPAEAVVLICAEQYPAELARRIQQPPPRELVWVMPPSALLTVTSAIHFSSAGLALPCGPDGIHPVASGYAQWAGALWQWIT